MAPDAAGESVAPVEAVPQKAGRRRQLLVGIVTASLILGVIAVVLASTTHDSVVPRLVGSPLATAERSLASKELKWKVVHLPGGVPHHDRQGVVLLQDPGAGSAVAKGSTVQLNVVGTIGVDGPTVRIPDLVGVVQWMAYNAIVDRGLTPIVHGPRHHGPGYQYWTIVSQSPKAGTSLPVGVGKVTITMAPPPAIHVAEIVAPSECASAVAPGVRVVAAYLITSAQLKRPPISDAGPLSRQAPGSRWRMCYVVGPNVFHGFGGPSLHGMHPLLARPPAAKPQKDVYVYYRNGSLAEIVGMSTFRFVVAHG